MEFRLQDARSNHSDSETFELATCACLPSCIQLRYGKQMSSSKLDDLFKIKKDFLVGKDPAYFK